MKKLAVNLITVINVMLLLWVAASWIDVVLHNCSDQAYTTWNFWAMLVGIR